jgi:glutathione peroxidase
MFKKILTVLLTLVATITMAQNQNLYSFKVKDIDGKEFDLAQLKGKKVMIVNTASECGFTRQYKELEELYKKYKDQNFVIIGFPCNQFGGQEPGTETEIKSFCSKNYGVTFPMMSKVHVRGNDKCALYEWLTTKAKNGVSGEEVMWNFNKFLIDEKGNLVMHLGSAVEPLDDKILNWIH